MPAYARPTAPVGRARGGTSLPPIPGPYGPYPTPGLVILYGAYGSTAVHRVVNEQGGQEDLSSLGTKREAALFLSGMIAALYAIQP